MIADRVRMRKVWGGIKDGYWVNKYTGVKTDFGLGDSSIEDGIMSSPSWKSYCSEVQIPSGVTGLGVDCFRLSTVLTSITLPESLTSIGRECFRGCEALTSITLPDSVTSMGNNCFAFCASLTLATVLPAIPPTSGWSPFYSAHSSFNIKVRSPYVNAYRAATNWRDYASKISAI